MSFKTRFYLVAIVIVIILLLFVYLNALELKAQGRLRYTLIDVRFSFLFYNSDELPFTVLREMCWNSTEGFCDAGLEGADEIYYLIDWQSVIYGAIFRTEDRRCFWWNYQSEWGTDNNPHIAEHYWIECPVMSLN